MKAIFLDRDGTLNVDKEYMVKFEDFELIPGVITALHIFRDLGYRLFVVSNQSGIARRYFTYADVEKLQAQTDALFRSHGISFDDMVFCPHHPDGKDERYLGDCDCRKPKPGMILELARKHGIDLSKSYMVGDKRLDAEAGVNAGATGVWLRIPGGRYEEPGRLDKAENIKEFLSLLDFAEFLREFDGRNGPGTAPRRPKQGAG
jgi:D-glycero-D-manno-heptose 1,7-bisphosphate phosphatase